MRNSKIKYVSIRLWPSYEISYQDRKLVKIKSVRIKIILCFGDKKCFCLSNFLDNCLVSVRMSSSMCQGCRTNSLDDQNTTIRLARLCGYCWKFTLDLPLWILPSLYQPGCSKIIRRFAFQSIYSSCLISLFIKLLYHVINS